MPTATDTQIEMSENPFDRKTTYAYAEGLRWVDRGREISENVAQLDQLAMRSVVQPANMSGNEDTIALAYAQGMRAGQELITGLFVGTETLTTAEIWNRLNRAIDKIGEVVDRPTVRPPGPRHRREGATE